MKLAPIFLSPRTPSELLSYIISYHRHPTTLLIGCARQDFLQTLLLDVTQPPAPSASENDVVHNQQPREEKADPHPLLRAPLMQVVVSRHIRIVFVPTVTHLRAYLATFSVADSKIAAPPLAPEKPRHPPLLLVYGFLELHRGASEWSAQGLSISTAALVDAAVGNHMRATVVEPTGAGGHEDADQFLDESVPILNGSSLKNNGTWRGRVTQVRRVFDVFGFTAANESLDGRVDVIHLPRTRPIT